MIVDYADLLPTALDSIPRHFGFTPDAGERRAMAAASKLYSKDPLSKFAPDSAAKRLSADARIHELAEIHLDELSKYLQTLGHM